MINLLPDKNKQEISKEYRLRRLAVALLLCFILTLLISVFLVPSYIISLYRVREASLLTGQTSAQSNDFAGNDLKNKIDDTKKLVKVLAPESYIPPSQIISYLVKHKTSDNIITSISYSRNDEGLSVVVKGIAKNRKSLVAFTDALGRESGIEKVDVPVSNYVKDIDISFVFTITARDK